MNCFDVFIIVLVVVIFLVVHLRHDHLVTTFELSHILTNTLSNVYLLPIWKKQSFYMARYSLFVLKVRLPVNTNNQPTFCVRC